MTNQEKFIEVFGNDLQKHYATKSWWDEEYLGSKISVIDDIKAEIMAEIISHSGTGEEVLQAYVDGLRKSIEFFDKHINFN